ncbi:MAG: rhomboid family intramembrane serine protease [Haloferacaceae archaeon]
MQRTLESRLREAVAAVDAVALPDCAPAVSVALAAGLAAVFFVQLALVPGACAQSTYPAYCAAYVLADGNSALGLALLPFLHGYPLHAAVNVLTLLFFGAHAECRFGRRRLVVLFLAGAYLGIFLQMLWNLGGTGSPLSLGASGAIYALAVAPGTADVLTHGRAIRERQTEYPLAVVGLLVLLSAVLAALGVFPDARATATVAHLVGALVGVFYGAVWSVERGG